MAFNPRRFFRQVHYWLSLAVALPAMLIIGAGIVLMLKKEIGWIQPPTARGVASAELPAIDYEALVAASRLHPEAGIETWTYIDRIDLRVESVKHRHKQPDQRQIKRRCDPCNQRHGMLTRHIERHEIQQRTDNADTSQLENNPASAGQ